jgi:hypothetical protein
VASASASGQDFAGTPAAYPIASIRPDMVTGTASAAWNAPVAFFSRISVYAAARSLTWTADQRFSPAPAYRATPSVRACSTSPATGPPPAP